MATTPTQRPSNVSTRSDGCRNCSKRSPPFRPPTATCSPSSPGSRCPTAKPPTPSAFDNRLGYAFSYGYGASNQAYLATLTDEQALAWNLDLSGNGDPSAAPTDRPSCDQVAFDEVNAAGGAGPSVDIGLAGVDPRYDPNQDPRVTAANEAWRACANRAGYDLRFPADAQRFLQRRQEALVRAANEAWDPRSNELPSVAPERIAALQDEERALAAMDHRCDLEVGLTSSRLATDTDIAAALHERFPEVVVEPYDPNLR